MSLEKTEGVILRSIPKGETSKILTVYTRDFGKLALIAKGAKGPKSKFGGILEPLSHLAIVFYMKDSREVQLLSQGDLLNFFPGIRQDLEKTWPALAVCDLLNRLMPPRSGVGKEKSRASFGLLLDVLRGIDGADRNLINFWWWFLIKLIKILGYRLELVRCVRCRQAVEGTMAVRVEKGGVICPRCDDEPGRRTVLTAGSLRFLVKLSRLLGPAVSTLNPSKGQVKEIDFFLDQFLKFHIESFQGLKSIKFWREMRDRP